MIIVLKDVFTAVSAVTVGKISSECALKYLPYYKLRSGELNETSATTQFHTLIGLRAVSSPWASMCEQTLTVS